MFTGQRRLVNKMQKVFFRAKTSFSLNSASDNIYVFRNGFYLSFEMTFKRWKHTTNCKNYVALQSFTFLFCFFLS